MLKKLYDKDQVWFAVLFIIIYVVGSSLADQLSTKIGVEKSITLLFCILLIIVLYNFIKKNKMMEEYGLCKVDYPISKWIFYIPFVVIASVNLWFGIKLNMTVMESVIYVASMLLVGFLEEVIFRGLLFKAMSKSNVTAAIIVSSITFGMGHIVNLINGSGVGIASNICQLVYATAIGFLFVTAFYFTKSLWPCIVTHSVVNTLSAFANEPVASSYRLQVTLILTVIGVGYSLFLWKIAPKSQSKNT